jgi:hypothetical protein
VQVFRARTSPEAIDLVSRLLEYTPSARITPLQVPVPHFLKTILSIYIHVCDWGKFPWDWDSIEIFSIHHNQFFDEFYGFQLNFIEN